MSNNDLRIFGNRIRLTRQEMGISQEELAALTGLHRTYIGGIERGERNIGLINVLVIAGALQIPVSKLFRDFDEKDGTT
ncbi:helix-turn-helix domain-containing protein [Lysobacter capsici]|uniref:helix-turn-helix domain-containing protein n=1 Tax=Lysobacter capsici TaxID=435897 RepID=UPI0009E99B78|nr:helix-turn-helix transcriptional regulator [Lysobacter capsici]